MVTLIARLDVESVDWFGTSMGGLIGMAFAGLPGSPLRRMIVNDVGPRIEPESLTRIGEYLGVQPRFATRQEGIDYLTSLSLPFGALTADEWSEINGPLLRELPEGAGRFATIRASPNRSRRRRPNWRRSARLRFGTRSRRRTRRCSSCVARRPTCCRARRWPRWSVAAGM